MDAKKSIGSGVAGALVLTLLHETIKKFVPNAPRMDHLGMEVLRKGKVMIGMKEEDEETLYKQTMAGDLALNSAFYSLVGSGKNAWIRGLAIGAGAGLGAVFLPKALDLNEGTSSRTNATAAMTIGLYTFAGLVAGGVSSWLNLANGHHS